jgi:hypothetical protein
MNTDNAKCTLLTFAESSYDVAIDCFGRLGMPNHAVELKVTPCLRIECQFWLGDDGWNGSSKEPFITVQADSFAQAKADMELALGKHIETLLNTSRTASTVHAA